MKKKPDTRTAKKEEDFRFGVFTEDYLIYENLIRKRLTWKRSLPQILPLHRPKREKEDWTLVNRNLVGRCGLYRGACSIYRGHKDDGEYLKLLAEYFKCPPEKVRCSGWQALKTEDGGYECNIVQCLRGKGLGFFYQCDEYENGWREKFGELAAWYLEDGEDVRASSERIKNGETEAWLRECEEKYKCPECGKPLPVGRMKRKCYHCGADLSKNS